MLEDARKEAKREFDMKYIRILLHHGLSIEEIAKEAKLDKLYAEEIKSEIESKKKPQIESERNCTKWEEAQHDDRINFVSIMLERFSPEEIADKMGWDDAYMKVLKSEIDSPKNQMKN